MKNLLIDGNSLINRAFYALPVLSTADGVYTNGIYGFLKMMYRAIDDFCPDRVICAFDIKKPTFRHERFPEYKAGRKKMPEELVPQIPLLQEILIFIISVLRTVCFISSPRKLSVVTDILYMPLYFTICFCRWYLFLTVFF